MDVGRLVPRTRQVVAYAIGDRSQATCQKLWAAIPAAYPGVIVTATLGGVSTRDPLRAAHGRGKESGLTAHVERWNKHAAAAARRFVMEEFVVSKSTRCTNCVCDSSYTIT